MALQKLANVQSMYHVLPARVADQTSLGNAPHTALGSWLVSACAVSEVGVVDGVVEVVLPVSTGAEGSPANATATGARQRKAVRKGMKRIEEEKEGEGGLGRRCCAWWVLPLRRFCVWGVLLLLLLRLREEVGVGVGVSVCVGVNGLEVARGRRGPHNSYHDSGGTKILNVASGAGSSAGCSVRESAPVLLLLRFPPFPWGWPRLPCS